MKISIISILFFGFIGASFPVESEIQLEGKWLGEFTNGSVILLDFKNHQNLTVGQIGNSSGPLSIEKFNGKWKLDNDTLKLRLNDLNQILKIEDVYRDSVVFIPDETNDISLNKLVKLFYPGKDRPFGTVADLVGKRMIDTKGNKYEFQSCKTFEFTNSETGSLQDKKWCVLEFNGVEIVFLSEYEWFANRVFFVPWEKREGEIKFRYYYQDKVKGFVLRDEKLNK